MTVSQEMSRPKGAYTELNDFGSVTPAVASAKRLMGARVAGRELKQAAPPGHGSPRPGAARTGTMCRAGPCTWLILRLPLDASYQNVRRFRFEKPTLSLTGAVHPPITPELVKCAAFAFWK